MKQTEHSFSKRHWFARIDKYKKRFPEFDFCLLEQINEETTITEPPDKKNKTGFLSEFNRFIKDDP